MTHYTRREFTGLAAKARALPFSRSPGQAAPGSATAPAHPKQPVGCRAE